MTVLVIAEHDNNELASATLNLINAATQLNGPIEVLVAGCQCTAVCDELQAVSGVSKIFLADDPAYEHGLAESLAPLVVKLGSSCKAIMAAASTAGKDLLPRVAALLDVAQISEITAIVDESTFVRPIYAGNALATVQSQDAIKVITVRCSAFAEAQMNNSTPVPVETVTDVMSQDMSRFSSENLVQSARPELGAAKIVISGGRGLGSAENFQLLERIADKLGAAIGASRAAVDAGYVGNELQVGQTGKIVAPDLYIAVGISGAIQHLAGMKESKVIVAINTDPEAPIFQIADYGLVADLFEVLPQMEALL